MGRNRKRSGVGNTTPQTQATELQRSIAFITDTMIPLMQEEFTRITNDLNQAQAESRIADVRNLRSQRQAIADRMVIARTMLQQRQQALQDLSNQPSVQQNVENIVGNVAQQEMSQKALARIPWQRTPSGDYAPLTDINRVPIDRPLRNARDTMPRVVRRFSDDLLNAGDMANRVGNDEWASRIEEAYSAIGRVGRGRLAERLTELQDTRTLPDIPEIRETYNQAIQQALAYLTRIIPSPITETQFNTLPRK